MSQFDLPRPRPPRSVMEGRFTRLEPFSVKDHARDLFMAYAEDAAGEMWRYFVVGPFATLGDYVTYARQSMSGSDPLYFAIIDGATNRATGVASFLNITPEHGSIEVGAIALSPKLQRTPAATEAMYLMMKRAFDELGYRRYEWKCNDRNEPSKRAAERFGFKFEGVFRQHMIVKGENRDTAWFSIIDKEWPALEKSYEGWLHPDNFDSDGNQKRRLEDFRKSLA
jgi:RimJ/RimL family protein N-acetyltransferase